MRDLIVCMTTRTSTANASHSSPSKGKELGYKVLSHGLEVMH